MLCAQQTHVVETIIKREMALLIKFLKMVMYLLFSAPGYRCVYL